MGVQFTVDQELCIGCGECVKDCPYGLLLLEADVPVLDQERAEMCMQCQHCLAVCTTGALGILGLNPADSLSLPLDLPSAKQLANLMKARRSVRQYQQEAVSREDIDFLVATTTYAPTGRNNRQVLLTVVDDPAVMDDLRRITYQALVARLEGEGFPQGMEFMAEIVKDAVENERDTVFRGAPHLLIASSPADGVSPEADCFIALSYFELLAASMGLGALWCGLAKWALTMIAPDILNRLGVPESHSVGYMLAFGKPAVTYHRTVQRDDIRVNRVEAIVG